jgi:hypothetical protein
MSKEEDSGANTVQGPMKLALRRLAKICTCNRPTIQLESGSVQAPGPHTEKCVAVIARQALNAPSVEPAVPKSDAGSEFPKSDSEARVTDEKEEQLRAWQAQFLVFGATPAEAAKQINALYAKEVQKVQELREALRKTKAFKNFVHRRLDTAGVPKEKEEYENLGFLSAAPPERSISLWCDKCRVKWVGCQDAAECPKCSDTTAWQCYMSSRVLEKKEASEHSTHVLQMADIEELIERRAKDLYGAFIAGANGKTMEECIAIETKRLQDARAASDGKEHEKPLGEKDA